MGANDNRANLPKATSMTGNRREQAERDCDNRQDALGNAGDMTGDGAARPPRPPPTDITPNRYLLLDIPNYNGAEAEADQMSSYLRLGTVEDVNLAGNPDAPRATGEDLASIVTSFLDDERRRDGCPDFVTEEARKAETARLHYKGGWRYYSDGNRITTTRGDKVQVIRGSYKLVVLGRQDAPHGGAGLDVSGGHIEGLGAKSCIEWVQTFDGTWKVTETSEKGDTDTTQHGNSVSRSYGDIIHSTTGSDDETRPGVDASGAPTLSPRRTPPSPMTRGRSASSRTRDWPSGESRSCGTRPGRTSSRA